MSRTLEQWLDYQQRVHARAIDLGLDRLRTVWVALGAPAPAPALITVGGTNGKGSTVAFLDAMLRADGRRVGCYTSPHLLRYNERVRIDGVNVSDVTLVAAFERIESARGEISLTYFEFATLAAFLIFSEADLDVAVLEVGLGGRLDAVNLLDADASIVTTVDLDHQDWLGDERDSIGREKAGIFRTGRPAIVGESCPPDGLLHAAAAVGAQLRRGGIDFVWHPEGATWSWQCGPERLSLPAPALHGEWQYANAAAAIAALHALRPRLSWNPHSIARGVASANIAARLQGFAVGPIQLLIDVAHNPQAAQRLAEWLRAEGARRGRTLAVFSALSDKAIETIVDGLNAQIDHWFLAGLASQKPRGMTVSALRERVCTVIDPARCSNADSVSQALGRALAQAQPGDRIVAFGSFVLSGEVLEWAQQYAIALDGPVPAPAQV